MPLHLLDREYQQHINEGLCQDNQTCCWSVSLARVRNAIRIGNRVYLYNSTTNPPFLSGVITGVETCQHNVTKKIITFIPDNETDNIPWPEPRSQNPVRWT